METMKMKLGTKTFYAAMSPERFAEKLRLLGLQPPNGTPAAIHFLELAQKMTPSAHHVLVDSDGDMDDVMAYIQNLVLETGCPQFVLTFI